MCLILFSYDPSSNKPLLLAANRDEFFSRPTAAAHEWDDFPNVFAGRDLVAQGTWLGITANGRFAAITNIREPSVVVENPLSRGDLTRRFLTSHMSAKEYLTDIESVKHRYCGFNLLVGELGAPKRELWYLSNRGGKSQRLSAGTYGLSNHLLDSAWPKVTTGKIFMKVTQSQMTFIQAGYKEQHQKLRAYLENHSLADDNILPKTGVSYQREKALSAAFITLSDYGTRTSTVLSIENDTVAFSEKSYQLELSQLIPEGHEYTYKEWSLQSKTWGAVG
ncbi:MAG: hypothetical protein ACJATV_000530 [Granulosicoccus sp.]|jgi:uncharacterized protein with NRDE domain